MLSPKEVTSTWGLFMKHRDKKALPHHERQLKHMLTNMFQSSQHLQHRIPVIRLAKSILWKGLSSEASASGSSLGAGEDAASTSESQKDVAMANLVRQIARQAHAAEVIQLKL